MPKGWTSKQAQTFLGHSSFCKEKGGGSANSDLVAINPLRTQAVLPQGSQKAQSRPSCASPRVHLQQSITTSCAGTAGCFKKLCDHTQQGLSPPVPSLFPCSHADRHGHSASWGQAARPHLPPRSGTSAAATFKQAKSNCLALNCF